MDDHLHSTTSLTDKSTYIRCPCNCTCITDRGIGYADLASIQADADIINTGKISSMGSNTSMGAGGLIGYGIDISIISRNGMLQNKGEVTAAIKVLVVLEGI